MRPALLLLLLRGLLRKISRFCERRCFLFVCVLRLHAVLRRRGSDEAPGAPAQQAEQVRFGSFMLDLGSRTLHRNGELVSITTGEFAVLKVLVRHPRQPLSRDKLMELARGREYEAFDRSLDVQISRLRKLIETDPAKPRFMQTVWGLGYVFVPDDGA